MLRHRRSAGSDFRVRRAAVEILESRRLLTAIAWNGGAGDWSVAGGVIDFAADATVTDIYHGFINNAGTILKSGGTGVLDFSNESFTNSGMIEAESGTSKLGNVGSSLPAGQTLQADAGAAITTANGAIADNQGTIILSGAGASIPAIAGLTENDGSFSVHSGASFATAGDLTNTGTLTVGGSLTVRSVSLGAGKSHLYHLKIKLPTTLTAGTFNLLAQLDPADSLNNDQTSNVLVIDAAPVTVS
jgi:hypothetical protein